MLHHLRFSNVNIGTLKTSKKLQSCMFMCLCLCLCLRVFFMLYVFLCQTSAISIFSPLNKLKDLLLRSILFELNASWAHKCKQKTHTHTSTSDKRSEARAHIHTIRFHTKMGQLTIETATKICVNVYNKFNGFTVQETHFRDVPWTESSSCMCVHMCTIATKINQYTLMATKLRTSSVTWKTKVY